jgi:hypothetical protein
VVGLPVPSGTRTDPLRLTLYALELCGHMEHSLALLPSSLLKHSLVFMCYSSCDCLPIPQGKLHSPSFLSLLGLRTVPGLPKCSLSLQESPVCWRPPESLF